MQENDKEFLLRVCIENISDKKIDHMEDHEALLSAWHVIGRLCYQLALDHWYQQDVRDYYFMFACQHLEKLFINSELSLPRRTSALVYWILSAVSKDNFVKEIIAKKLEHQIFFWLYQTCKESVNNVDQDAFTFLKDPKKSLMYALQKLMRSSFDAKDELRGSHLLFFYEQNMHFWVKKMKSLHALRNT